jgi:tetratricopeptide (TPR) repeat protein
MPPVTLRPSVLVAAAIAVVALAYSNALGGGFVWDDHHLIEDRAQVLELGAPWTYFTATFWDQPEQRSAGSFYRPLVTLSYAVDHRLWRGHPFGFHLTNLLLHLACVALVWALARRAGATPPAAALAAALFGTLPRLSESVAWISGRTDVLACACVLAALLAHRRAPDAGRRRIGAAALLLAGLFAKEVALAGAFALVALELAEPGGRWRRPARNLAPLGITLLLYAAARTWALSPGDGADVFAPWERGVFALQALGTYALMLLDPLRPRLRIGLLGVVEWWRVALGALALVGVAAALLRVGAARRVWIVLATTALLPVLHLAPIPVTALAADRFLYLPVAALAVALASAARPLPRPLAGGAGALAALGVLVFSIALVQRTSTWLDEVALLEHAAEHASRGDGAPHASLGTAHLRAGRFEKALHHFRESQRIERAFAAEHPRFRVNSGLLGSIAICEAQLGRYGRAAATFEDLVELEPEVPLHRYNLAVAYVNASRPGAAKRALEGALAIHPAYPEARRLYERLRRAPHAPAR